MAMVEPGIAHSLMTEIQLMEASTDLKRVAVISRTGMRIATSTSDQMDADAETASSAALIDLADRISSAVSHGNLREILVKADKGFVILQFINDEFMIFGGISNPYRVGYYMEFLRNAVRRLAFILAGNVVTEGIRKEIEAQKEREKLEAQKGVQPLAAGFQSDKSTAADMDAMKGVLDFLKNWGEEGNTAAAKPNADNIVSIDKDLMFGVDNFAPAPISPDQIQQAQQVQQTQQAQHVPEPTPSKSPPVTEKSAITSTPVSPPTPVPESKAIELTDVGLPADILATLDEITSISTPAKVDTKKEEKKKSQLPFGIPLYDNEVPPVPLEDYVSFEIGTLRAAGESAASTAHATQHSRFGTKLPPLEGIPDINAFASEYDEPDVLQEDAMMDALSELGLAPEKKKQK